MNRFYLLAIIMSCTLFSCSQDTCINDVSDIQNLNLSRASLPEMKVLEFENQDDFENAVSQAQCYIDSIKSYAKFVSLYDEYDEAWKVADEYYTSEAKYKEFKKKFSHLYFPEYQDDYSFFLPVKNEEMAKLLNPEGFVKIGNELINFIDITTPEDLIALRLLAPSDAVTFSVDHNTIFENNIPQQDNGKRRF